MGINNLRLFWEDRLKRGEYFVTNKVVKISEALGGRLPLGWSPFVKCYIEGDSVIELWFRLTSMEDNSCDFLAIMKCATCHDSHRTNENSVNRPPIWQANNLPSLWTDTRRFMEDRADDRTSMFVIVPEAIKNPERMRVWVIPSFVWLVGLETFNEVYGSLRETAERFQFSGKQRTCITNRKVKVPQGCLGTSRKVPKLPNQVVQNGTEVMDTITSDKTQIQWRLFPALHLNPQELIDSITVFLGHHFIMNTFKEPSGLTLEILQVLSCPVKTPMKVFKVGGHNSVSPKGDYTTG